MGSGHHTTPVVMCMGIFIIYYPIWWHNGPIMGWWTGWCHNGTLMALDPASQFISYWNLMEEADMERLQINKWAHYLWCTFILYCPWFYKAVPKTYSSITHLFHYCVQSWLCQDGWVQSNNACNPQINEMLRLIFILNSQKISSGKD